MITIVILQDLSGPDKPCEKFSWILPLTDTYCHIKTFITPLIQPIVYYCFLFQLYPWPSQIWAGGFPWQVPHGYNVTEGG